MTVLDDIAFLANSENRVAVLQSLAEAPRSHDEVRTQCGASRVTTARILRDLEERHWISRSGQECTITPTGEWVYGEFARLMEELGAERRLRDPLQRLPADVLTFDVRRLREAELVVHEESDATAIIRRILDFRRSSDRIWGLTRMVAPVFIETDWESTVDGDTHLDMVITPGVLDAIRTHRTSTRQVREMLDEPHVNVAVTPDIPISIGIYDDAVGIDLTDEQGVVKGGFISEDATVREWAVELFESYRAEARPLTPEEVTVDDSVSVPPGAPRESES